MAILIPIEKAKIIIPAMQRGFNSAINKLMAKAKTEASKAVRKRYRVKARDLNKKTRLERAQRGRSTSSIIVSGASFTLKRFNPRETKRGISVEIIKGRRLLVRSAFVALGRGTGNVQIFRRERKDKGGLVSRYPIKVLKTVGPAKMFEREGEKAITRSLDVDFNPIINKEVDFQLSKVV